MVDHSYAVHSADEWDKMYSDGRWAYLGNLDEAPRFALIAGYIHRSLQRGLVLDAGCGDGHLFGYLDGTRVNYKGFDPAQTAIETARRQFSAGAFSVGAIETFEPENGERFDAIVFNEVLSQVAAPLEAIDRFRTMQTDHGLTIISLFQSPNETSNARIVTDMLDQEIRDGRFQVLTSAEVVSGGSGLRWRVTVLR